MKKCLLLFFLFFLNCFCFSIISPKNGQEYKGKIEFNVNTDNLKNIETIEYLLDGKKFSGLIQKKPYNFIFESSLLWDGEFYVDAIARDISGKIIGKADTIRFKINNRGNFAQIKIVSPENINKPLKDKVKWRIETVFPLTKEDIDYRVKNNYELKPIEAVMCFIDGKLEKLNFGSPFLRSPEENIAPPAVMEFEMDTSKYLNGKHELFISVWAHSPGTPPIGMYQTIFEIDNGKKIRDIRPFWDTVYLKVGENIKISPYILYTDGTREEFKEKVEYENKNKDIVEIDENGLIKSLKGGVGEIVMKVDNYVNSIRIVVNDFDGFPHFSKDGKILYSYNPEKSIFIRAPFNLSPSELTKNPDLPDIIKFSGVNALTTGFYLNPADSGTPGIQDFEEWKRGWSNWIKPAEEIAKKYDFSLVLTGDDICRTPNELHNSVTNPWSKDAIQWAFKWARDSKIVSCIEMMDEASLWGPNPLPSEDEIPNWEKANPSSPKDAFKKLIEIINGVPERPPISWPVLGLSGSDVAKNWMGNPFMSDYTSHYWDILDWRRAYPYYGGSYSQYRTYLDKVVVERSPFMQRNKPFLLLVSICGPFYKKMVEGNQFQPGNDVLVVDGVNRKEAISFQVMYSVAKGGSGVRCYAYDSSWWKYERENAKIGGILQTGAEPFEIGTERWNSLSSSFNLIKELEPLIFQEMTSSIDVGPEIITGAKKSDRGNLLIIINSSEVEQKINVPLFPYSKNNKNLVRYRLLGAELITEKISYKDYDLVNIQPAETIIWVFYPENEKLPSSIKFNSPFYDETIGGQKKVIVICDKDIEEVNIYIDGKVKNNFKKAPFEFILDTEGLKEGVHHSLVAIGKNKDNKESQARTTFFIE